MDRAKYTKFTVLIVLVFATALTATVRAVEKAEPFEWGKLSDIPGIGYAGAYAGISGGKLIFAGGANFPNGKSSTKVWYDRIYTLDIKEALNSSKDKESPPVWQESNLKLPLPTAYGVSVTYHTKDGRELVICVGGQDGERCYRNVLALEYINGEVRLENLPELPEATACMAGALIGSKLYVACGISAPDVAIASNNLYQLDLEQLDKGWQKLASVPAAGRVFAVAAVQDNKFYIMSGAELQENEDGKVKRKYLKDTWQYSSAGGWKKMADLPRSVLGAPSPAFPVGQSHFMVFGGDDGTLVGEDVHPNGVLAYHTATNTWVEYADMDDTGTGASVAAPGVEVDGTYIAPGGQVQPGTTTTRVYTATPRPYEGRFGLIDYGTIAIYLAVLLGVGFYFSSREKGTDDYFLGGRRVPWFVAGLSTFATLLSSITYMAMPAKAFNTNWLYFAGHLSLMFTVPVVIYFYLPFFRGLNISSAYEYLEHRFNVVVRLCGTVLFTGFHIGRMAVVLLLPSMALATISPINVYVCIIILAGLCIIYTVLGGIEAVVWTDAIQSLVLFFGAFLVVVIILSDEAIGLGRFWEVVVADGKGRMFDFRADHTAAVFWVVFVGSFFSNLSSYTSDQAVVQRYLVTPSEKTAAKALWTSMLVGLPIGFLFLFVGVTMF